MKLKNKKFKFLSAFVSTSAIVTLVGAGATSCAKTYKAQEEIKSQNASEQTNGLYSTVNFSPNGGVLHGDSSVKVRTGKPFGSIKAPTVT
ncbi:MAG: hypothetical protein MJ219_00155 [Mycoplasmoidaceae bacterium]|nr:hypothetical protein [Mycoplasmoidaceae bacterium]